ncbi:hypothetical protein [Nocardioides iriomotensis]|uniref:Uncharacterized protein n=1 Tax=Nocardioides iriomotensis TaxID=715784 RepID=A0A4V1Z1H7_9ACTN|nr:hypothetical protein [Nocardioides iriomotensis]RYU10946.1 hypothetical protein ETU37_14630 [Nocardioides iriomotensis]
MTRSSRPLLAAVAALAVPALLAAPAGAASRSIPDAKGDVHQGVDLEKVTVVYGQKWLKIRTQHRNLVPLPKYSAGLSVFLDTDRTDPGPELRFGGGLMDGTDYSLATADSFAPSGDVTFVKCDYRMRLDYDRDVARIRLAPDCVDEVDEIRVSVKAAAEQGSLRAYDWLGEKRSWWAVSRG